MRVVASGNLTIELIRAQRFDVAYRADSTHDQPDQINHREVAPRDDQQQQIDRVELSPESLACDPWATPTDRANHSAAPAMPTETTSGQDEQPLEPKRITPVVGSPALAGLGVALVVPGTLLDVVA